MRMNTATLRGRFCSWWSRWLRTPTRRVRSGWPTAVYEYSTQDPGRAPQNLLGWVVRANAFHNHADGTDDVMIGGRLREGHGHGAGDVVSPVQR